MGQNSFILNDNFGIGTSSPISKLTIGSGTNTYPTTPSSNSSAEITLNAASLVRLVMNDGTGNFQQYLNSYYDLTSATHKYTTAGVQANRFSISAGTFGFYVAPTSVSAGDTITWTTGLCIDNSGNVGIGITSPSDILHVSKANGVSIFESPGVSSVGLRLRTNTTDRWQIGCPSASADLAIYTGAAATERLRIDSSGNVGIGTAPINTLHLYKGTASVGATQLELEGVYNGYGAGINFSSRTSSGGTLVTMAKITADGEDSWNTTGTTQDAGLRFSTTANGTLTERLRIDSSGNVTVSTGSYISTRANNTADGGGQIFLNGATGNRIDFNINGVAAPAFTTRSAGTRIVLYPNIGAAAVDFAFGIESSTLWSTVPNSGCQFKWYAGTTNIATLSGAGVLTATTFSGALSGNASSATYLNSSNYISRTGTSGNADTDFQNTPAGSVRHLGDDANVLNSPGGVWWFYDHYRHSNGSNLWGTQVAWGWQDNAKRLATRNVSNGVWDTNWTYYINTANYTSIMDAAVSLGSGNFPAAQSVTVATGALTNYSWLLIHIYNVSTTANSRINLGPAITTTRDQKPIGIATGGTGNGEYIFAFVDLNTGYGFSICDPQAVNTQDTSNGANGTTYVKYYGILKASTQIVIWPHTEVNFDAGQYYVYGII
jgi:hypothetical protein